jgi:hypothetical protein
VTASRIEQDLRSFARLQVRAGLLDPAEMRREVAEAIGAEMPGIDADLMARAWLAAAQQALVAEQAGWPASTDHDRLLATFADLESAGLVVLQGCEDHWAAKAAIEASHPLGVIWFTPGDVWHAIDHGMLEVNLWHGTTANIAPGDVLLDETIATFARHGLAAKYDEGRIEVAAFWHRRTP